MKETKADNKGDVAKGECSKGHKNKADVESKFENYFKFSAPIKSVKPYQVSEVFLVHVGILMQPCVPVFRCIHFSFLCSSTT